MASKERVSQLQQFCDQWRQSLKEAEERRDDLIKQQNSGVTIFTSDAEGDLLPTLILEADEAAKIYKKCLIKLESVRDRAIAGEDV